MNVTSASAAPAGTSEEHDSATGFGVFDVTATGFGNVAAGDGEGEATEVGDTTVTVDGDLSAVTPEGLLHAATTSRTDAKAAALIRAITPTPSEGYEVGGYTSSRQVAGRSRRADVGPGIEDRDVD